MLAVGTGRHSASALREMDPQANSDEEKSSMLERAGNPGLPFSPNTYALLQTSRPQLQSISCSFLVLKLLIKI